MTVTDAAAGGHNQHIDKEAIRRKYLGGWRNKGDFDGVEFR